MEQSLGIKNSDILDWYSKHFLKESASKQWKASTLSKKYIQSNQGTSMDGLSWVPSTSSKNSSKKKMQEWASWGITFRKLPDTANPANQMENN